MSHSQIARKRDHVCRRLTLVSRIRWPRFDDILERLIWPIQGISGFAVRAEVSQLFAGDERRVGHPRRHRVHERGAVFGPDSTTFWNG